MIKYITYAGLSASTVILIFAFVTAQSYSQLGIAATFYPLLAFLLLKAFPRESTKQKELVQETPLSPKPVEVPHSNPIPATTDMSSRVDIADIDKRAFLKIIGGAGLTFFLFSLLGKRTQVPFLGKFGTPDHTTIKNADGLQINPAEKQPLDGYQISEIDDSLTAYYGFINKVGHWIIMKQDNESMSFRYAKGNSNFPNSWKDRERLSYDYFYNVFN